MDARKKHLNEIYSMFFPVITLILPCMPVYIVLVPDDKMTLPTSENQKVFDLLSPGFVKIVFFL